MDDDQLEARLRAVLRGEGDALPFSITTQELERRRVLRRRTRNVNRLRFAAAGVAIVLIGSIAVASNGWLRAPAVGAGPSAAPTASPLESAVPTGPVVDCSALDPETLQEPPSLVMGVSPGDAAAYGGLRSSYRLGDRATGVEGTWDHDSIYFGSVPAGFGVESLQVLAGDLDACLIGLVVEAVPSDRPIDPPLRLAELESGPVRLIEFGRPPVGDWLLLVHAEFATSTGAPAWAETFFNVVVPDCAALDPSSTDTPPTIGLVASFEGSGARHPGTQVASAWNGRAIGSPGTWDGLPAEPDQVATAPGFDGLQVTASACLADVRAEALLTVYAQVPDPAPTPIELQVRRGEGTPIVDIAPPPTGGWTVRVRASFPTVDGSEAWSETLFLVASHFPAPGLTLGPEFFEIMGEATCPSYRLASGASAADQCGASYELMEGREPIPVVSGGPLEFRLEDDWVIDEARTIAVDAELVARGEFAPEYSVDFQESVGSTLTVPVVLDPGSWILRITLNGHRGGDTFGADYSIAVHVTP